MGLRFRRSIALFPGVRVNIGMRGLSFSLGQRGGPTLTWGAGGLHIGASLPGTGLSWRHRIGFHSRRLGDRRTKRANAVANRPRPAPEAVYASDVEVEEGIAELMSGLDGLRTERARVHLERLPLIKQRNALIERSRRTSGSWWRRLFYGHHLPTWRARIQSLTEQIMALDRSMDELSLDLDFDTDGIVSHAWETLCDAALALSQAAIALDVLNQAGTSTKGDQLLTVKPIRVSRDIVPMISRTHEAIRWQNRNGEDYVFYPGFLVLVGSDGTPICCVDYVDLRYSVSISEYKIPSGSCRGARILRQGFEHENRDGSPDRRMSRNRSMDVVQTGRLHLTADMGLDDMWMLSEPEAVRSFAKGLQMLGATAAT